MVAGYLFIMPFILGFLAFMVKPFLQSLYMSFCNVEISSTGFHMIFAGMANYIRAFTIDTEFNRLLVEEIAKMTYNSLAIMVFSFFVALILNQKFKGRAFVRAVFSFRLSYHRVSFLELRAIIHCLQVYRMRFRIPSELQALQTPSRTFL